MNRNSRWGSLSSLLPPLLFATSAIAGTVPNYTTWKFSGIVRHYYDVYSSVPITTPPPEFAAVSVLPGSLLTGHVTLDLDAPDIDPQSLRGQYGAIVAAGINVGDLSLHYTTSHNLTVVTNGAPSSAYGISTVFGLGDSHGIDILFGFLELFDSSRTALESEAIPRIPPALSALDPYDPNEPFATRAGFAVDAGSGLWIILAELVDVQQVPEPSAWLYTVGAMLGMGVFGFRRSRI